MHSQHHFSLGCGSAKQVVHAVSRVRVWWNSMYSMFVLLGLYTLKDLKSCLAGPYWKYILPLKLLTTGNCFPGWALHFLYKGTRNPFKQIEDVTEVVGTIMYSYVIIYVSSTAFCLTTYRMHCTMWSCKITMAMSYLWFCNKMANVEPCFDKTA